jgi:hypothetical protein
LIVEGVDDLTEHARRLEVDAYRPDGCPRCGQRMHVHDRRPRLLAGDVAGSTEIARYRCSDRGSCGAVWQVLPRLLARHLWRAWRTVEGAVVEPVKASAFEAVPARTRRRWRARLASSAALLITAPEGGAVSQVAAVAGLVATRATRGQFVDAVARAVCIPVGQRLSSLAELIHRLVPGVRVM